MINKITILITLFCNLFFILKYLHIYQLKSYKNLRFFKFFINFRLFYPVFCAFLLIFQTFLKNNLFFDLTNILLILINFIYNSNLIKGNKTPLKATNKIKRLYIICAIILTTLSFQKYAVAISCLCLTFLPTISNFLNVYDKILSFIYLKKSKQKIKKIGCKIIAITGSNGKTSIKNILYEMLITTYKVQATPKSYNTPLGISKFINTQLNANTEFLILEYGAKNKKDIKKLCKIFGADYGIISLVAPQHLESFKSMENIYFAKQELATFLQSKFCAFNMDNLYTLRMFYNKKNLKYGISIYSKSDFYATDITVKNFKTHFKLNINNNQYKVSTSLLGKHNITNILLATSLANFLNVKTSKILLAIKKLKPIEHRLEYIKSRINILDDSYNCSLSSATEAIEVLSYQKGKKVIATPGIIEGGKFQYKINFALGKLCAKSNQCIIIGETNKKAILDGLKSQNFNLDNVSLCPNLETAKSEFLKLTSSDTLLLLNDLPDDYK